MSKLRTLVRILGTIARRPSSLLRVLADEREHDVRGRLGLPRGLPTVDLLDLFPEFTATVAPYSFLEGTSTVIDIALLNALAARLDGGRYLEIGSWRGESVANVARHAAECVSLSLSAEEMRAMGWSEAIVRSHRHFSEGLPNVRHIGHNSHTFDFASLEGKFDLIFIDGDHTYEGVRNDTSKAFPLLRDEKSVIVWHDAGTTPENMRWDTLAGILDGCPPEFRGNIFRVSNTLCAIFLRNSPAASIPEVPRVPDKDFEVVIRARRR